MRTPLPFLSALVLATATTAQYSTFPDSTGLPGDGFSLSGALELFKSARDLQAFEQALNSEDNKVNNLDLDGDGQVDYIRVVGHSNGGAHAIVMQVALSKEERQDVAVIELEKNGAASATLQIRGAEELYGADVLVEPVAEVDAGMEPSKGPAPPELVRMYVWVNVWDWPCVGYLYGPSYVGWDSPWFWSYYPPWWRPWRPMGMHAWHRWYRTYHAWYRPTYTCHVPRAHAVYRPQAMHSPNIHRATAPMREQRATMRPAPTGRRVAPTPHPNDRTMDQRPPDVRGRDGGRDGKGGPVPQTRPERRPSPPRTTPAEPHRGDVRKAPAPQQPRETRPPQRPARTTPAQPAPNSPTRSPAPTRSPRTR
ncbi:MAG: hypothetical protein KF797_00620 [Flavobacteriales bacterium]|nr:hypothetical protein [Flavobacteriales bacterium]